MTSCGGLARHGANGESSSAPSQVLPELPEGLRPKGNFEANPLTPTPAKTPEELRFEAERSKLGGLWLRGCEPGVGTSSLRRGVEFTPLEVNSYIFYYQDDHCQILSSQSRLPGSYKLTLGEGSEHGIELTLDGTIHHRFFAEKAIQQANAAKICARANWQAGAEFGCVDGEESSQITTIHAQEDTLLLGKDSFKKK